MKRTTEELKAALLSRYEVALDELLERCEETDNFGELVLQLQLQLLSCRDDATFVGADSRLGKRT